MLKRTPLHSFHKNLGAKLIPFAGWEMPVHYSSIVDEHIAVRTSAGIFDVSHMGEIFITGPDAFDFIQYCITNDLSKIVDNQAIYSPICYDHGGTVDDLLVYKFNQEKYLIVVNAANIEKDYNWFIKIKKERGFKNVTIENKSDEYVQIAVQGPEAEQRLQPHIDADLSSIIFYHFIEATSFGAPALISRTGYTGEDGFELYLTPEDGKKVWQALIAEGFKPCGLGARDTLRLESGLALYGNDLSDQIKPTETIVKWTVKLGKAAFIGKDSLSEVPSRKMYGFEMLDKGIPRHNYEIYINNERVGVVTSGSYAPYLKKNIGLTLLNKTDLQIGDEILIKIRNEMKRAQIVKLPFYSKKYKK